MEEPLLTVDKLEDIFSQTVGSLRGSAGMVLWCWTQYSQMSLDWLSQAPLTYLSVLWLIGVALVRIAMFLNRRSVDGMGPHKLAKNDDLVVITGGSSGLGLLLLAQFSSDGFRTINIDKSPPAIPIANSQFYKCDISSCEQTMVLRSVLKDTAVLIHCAGTVENSLGRIEQINSDAAHKILETNLWGAINLTQQVLALNTNLKMVVGISSSTALVGPAYAGIYAASKAGLRTFLESLRRELRFTNARVLCATLGQLDTAMFSSVATPSPFWAPVVRASDVALEIYRAIHRGRQGELALPVYSRILPYILVLPQGLIDLLREFIGVDNVANI